MKLDPRVTREFASRLCVAFDFDPRKCGGRLGVEEKIIALAQELSELGVVAKLNSAVRALGYGIIDKLHYFDLKVFADLKLVDIPQTMEIDGAMLAEVKPDFVTVMCNADVAGMQSVQLALPETKVVGVTILTSLNDERCDRVYRRSAEQGVLSFAELAVEAGISGLILSPKEVKAVRADKTLDGLILIAPGVRPVWCDVEGDDQVRTDTPRQVMLDGATGLVIGRPITGAKPNSEGRPQSPREAVIWTLNEMATAVFGPA